MMRTMDDFDLFVRRFFGDCNLKIQRSSGQWFVSVWRANRLLAIEIDPSMLRCFERLMCTPRQPANN